MTLSTLTIDSVFAEAVRRGLTASSKYLPTRYIYDDKGDKIFQQIMELPEYYLTRSELEIFRTFKSEIVSRIIADGPFNLIELGAGDCLKTKILLQELQDKKADFVYSPIDISSNAIESVTGELSEEFPGLRLEPLQAEYFEAIKQIKQNGERLVVLFLGSNLGNFPKSEINLFIGQLSSRLSENDLLLIGVDLVKDPLTVLQAYDDSQNVTGTFNFNLLQRINSELGGQFDPDAFYFYPNYDPEDGVVKSYLVSTEEQEIYIEALDACFTFKQGEAVLTETSQKFSSGYLKELENLGRFRQIAGWSDEREYFKNLLWQKISD